MEQNKYDRGIIKSIPGVGILDAWGDAVPSDGASGYGASCLFRYTGGGGGTMLYVNQGSQSSCDFDAIGDRVDAAFPAFGTAALRGPSPLIWGGAPLLDVILDPTKGIYYWNDFDRYGGMSIADNGSYNDLTYTERTDGLLANMPTIPGGIVKLDSIATTADQGATMQILGLQIEPLTGTTIRMEWRCLVDDDAGQCFLGLCDDSITAPVTSSDAITTNDHAGFYRDAGTGSAGWTVGCGDGGSVEEEDDACTSTKTVYHKFGLVLEGIGAVAGSTCKFYFDGVLVFTTTDIDDLPLLLMCPAFQMDAGGVNVIMLMDWLRILVSHPTGLCRES